MLKLYGIFRDALSWIFLAIIAALVGEFAIDLAKEHGYFEHPTEQVEAVLSLLATIRDQWWFWPAVGTLAGLVVGMWVDSLVRRHASRPQTVIPGHIAQQPRPQAINPLEAYFSRKIIRVADLVHGANYVIAQKTFENCVLYGPGIIGFSGTGIVEDCTFTGGDRNTTFIEAQRPTLGAVGFRDCTFRHCEFIGLGIVGGTQEIERYRASILPRS